MRCGKGPLGDIAGRVGSASLPPPTPDFPRRPATGYYLLHCINLQASGKTRIMRKVARQYLLLTYVCDLAKSMPGRDARDAIKPLFKKMVRRTGGAGGSMSAVRATWVSDGRGKGKILGGGDTPSFSAVGFFMRGRVGGSCRRSRILHRFL